MIAKLIMFISLFWISPLVAKMQKNEAVSKKGIVIGVTLPKEALEDPEVKMLLDKYKKQISIGNWILLGIFALSLLIKNFIIYTSVYCLWCDLVLIVFDGILAIYNKKIKDIKKERNWETKKIDGKVSVDLSTVNTPKLVSPIYFLLFIFLSAIPVIFNKTAWPIVLINTLQVGIFYLCYRYCIRFKQEKFNDNQNLNTVLTNIRRTYWSKTWIVASGVTAVFSFSALIQDSNPGLFMFILFVYTFVIVWACFKNEMRVRTAQEELTKNETSDVVYDDDDYWIWGLLYYNKNDSNLMINKRTGMGTTINMAKPLGKAVMAITVAMLIAMPFLPLILDSSIKSDVSIVIENDAIDVSCGKSEWNISIDKIDTIELLYDYPENLRRTWGTGTDQILKGNFSATKIGALEVCMNPKETPYLLIKTTDNHCYLFGTKEDGVVEAIYHKVTQIQQ